MTFWRRLCVREKADFSQRWKAFIESPAAKGEPSIPPAKVPDVKQLEAVKVDIYEMFRKRHGR